MEKIITAIIATLAGVIAKTAIDALITWRKNRQHRFELEPLVGDWHGFFRNPDSKDQVEHEYWKIEQPNKITVYRDNKPIYSGTAEIRAKRIYITLIRLQTWGDEYLFLTFAKTAPREWKELHGLWLGENGKGCVLAGHGYLTKEQDDRGRALPLTLNLTVEDRGVHPPGVQLKSDRWRPPKVGSSTATESQA